MTTGFYTGDYNQCPNSYTVYLIGRVGEYGVAQRVVFSGRHPLLPSAGAFATLSLFSVTFMDAVDH